jgi:kynurenine formamidase
MKRIIDLTLTIEPGMRGVELHQAKTLETDGWNAKRLELYSHCGTHMDAPRHFLPQGSTIDTVDLTACIGPAHVIDLTPVKPRDLLTIQHLRKSAARIQPGDRLLLRTDWYKRHGTAEYRQELPRIHVDLAHWLVERGIALLGVEPPSVADVNHREELTSVHRVLLSGGVVIVEGLAHLDQIQTDIVDLIVLPLKILDGDGAPARAVAVQPPQEGFA